MRRAEISLGAPDFPVLNAFMGCRERNSFIMGPLGSGKTYGAVQRILAQMTEQEPNPQGIRPTRWLAVRNTYPDLMGTTVRDFCEVFEPLSLGKMKYGGLEPPTFRVDFSLDKEANVYICPEGQTLKSNNRSNTMASYWPSIGGRVPLFTKFASSAFLALRPRACPASLYLRAQLRTVE